MNERTVLIVDGGTPVPLVDLPDTGSWGTLRWSRAASVPLTQGEHVLKWQNVKGGGLTFAAFALSDDPAWKPAGTALAKPAADKHAVVVQAATFVRSQGKQLSVSGTSAGSPTEFHYTPGTFKPSWAATGEAEIHVFQSSSCRAFKEIVSLVKVDEPTRRITIGGKECVAPILPGDRYFVENVLEELDSPGEWYLNRQTGQLFHWPQAEILGQDGGRRPDAGPHRADHWRCCRQAAGEPSPLVRPHVPGHRLLAGRRLRGIRHGQRRRGLPERRHRVRDRELHVPQHRQVRGVPVRRPRPTRSTATTSATAPRAACCC